MLRESRTCNRQVGFSYGWEKTNRGLLITAWMRLPSCFVTAKKPHANHDVRVTYVMEDETEQAPSFHATD
jgi:hypothetical protein